MFIDQAKLDLTKHSMSKTITVPSCEKDLGTLKKIVYIIDKSWVFYKRTTSIKRFSQIIEINC